MKHRAVGRPIGKCSGCCLNMRRFCAAGMDPKRAWRRGRCKNWNDKSLLEAYLNPPPVTGAKAAKLSRRARASRARSTPHFDGQVFVPARGGKGAAPRP